MTYAASQNAKARTTHMAAALFATLILAAGIAALAMHPAEAFAKPLCVGVGPCYAGVNANASAADGASSLRDGMACMRSAIEGKLCAKRCLNGSGAAFTDENGLCPGKGLGYDWSSGSSAHNGNAYGCGNGNGYGACVNGGGCGYAHDRGHGICNGLGSGCQSAPNCPNR